jgi:ligand-binding sensor domain-containing protein
VFEDATSKFGLSDISFTAMSRDTSGDLLLWGPANRLLRFRGGQFGRIFARDKNEGIVISVLASPTGVYWLGTRDAGLYQVEKGNFAKVLSDAKLQGVNALALSENGGVWIGSESGLYLWEHGTSIQLRLPEGLRKVRILALIRDHNHNLWVGTDTGLYRINSELRTVTGFYRNKDDPQVCSIYEDNQGDIWFGGSKGIERFRDGMFTSFSAKETSLKEIGGPLFVDNSGRVWFGPTSGGLFCLENGIVRRMYVPGLNDDVIYSIDGSKNEIWLGRQRGGLTELIRHGKEWQTRTYARKDGLPQDGVYTVTRARDGSVWAGTVSSGVAVLRHGKIESYSVNNGLPSNAIFYSLETTNKKMWFASPKPLWGCVRIKVYL